MSKTTRFFLFLFILAICWYLGRFIDVDIEKYQELFSRYPLFLSGVIFVILYVGVTFFVWFAAKDIFRISSALIFGPYVSALLVYLGELGNCLVLFHLARKLGQDYVVQKFGLKKEDLEKSKERKGSFGAFTLRINPLIPYRFQDLGAGLSTISFKQYFPAIALASAPRILFFQYVIAGVGMSIFKDFNHATAYMQEHSEILIFGSLYLFFVIAMTAAYFINKRLQKRRATNI
ncbi:MAG TPA: VTT domain-containing protein [Candidatus Omnitrophota bacterium]|nr:VTT domain-containing protein [Candidatus Omnitrophota bacterium]